MQKKRGISAAGLGVVVVILILCELASMTVLFGRMIPYTEAKFLNILPLTEGENVTEISDETEPERPESIPAATPATPDEAPSGAVSTSPDATPPATVGTHHPEFRMEAEAEIFRFFYDETGKVTVIGVEGNPDKLIAPGTSNLYQFTLANTGDVALDYTLEMEAWVTGTDLWLPVYARLWDYTGTYLVGSSDAMVDVLELNTVDQAAELGAGRYASYYLEWEWPFEWGDDEYDTMLGNLAVDEDLVLHIAIRTYAEYDEEPDNPNTGIKPPDTGDSSQLFLFVLICVISFIGLCVLPLVFFKSRRKEEQA